jgi:hypothetical protein
LSRNARIRSLALVATLAMLEVGLAGCVVTPPRGGGPPRGPEGLDHPPSELLLMRVTIVDVNPAGGTITVKDDQNHGTWTVMVTEETRIFGSDGAVLALKDLRTERKVQIKGTSRIEAILRAQEITEIGATP